MRGKNFWRNPLNHVSEKQVLREEGAAFVLGSATAERATQSPGVSPHSKDGLVLVEGEGSTVCSGR